MTITCISLKRKITVTVHLVICNYYKPIKYGKFKQRISVNTYEGHFERWKKAPS